MSTLINTIGTSPMVVSEIFQYIRNTDERLKWVSLLYTSDPEVVAGTSAVTGAIRSRYPDVHFNKERLEISDISDYESMYSFLERFADVIAKERNYGPMYINISGGRKIQSISLSIYASFAGVSKIYNVINKDVKNFNERYERIKDLIIDDFSNCHDGDEDKIYKKRKDVYDPIFFPSGENLVFLEFPVLNLPKEEKELIRRAIDGVTLEDSGIDEVRIRAYRDSGFITYDRTRTYGTRLGEIIRIFL